MLFRFNFRSIVVMSCFRLRFWILAQKMKIVFFRLVHVIWDFCSWDVMTKIRYFLMVQIHKLKILEVVHDLETYQRP